MVVVYGAFFQKQLPRVLPKMKETLQSSLDKMIGDWFFLEQGKMIKIYGFFHQPYRPPAFLNLTVFALELIRQRLIVENEHFLSFRKSSGIKFPWTIDPFTIKK